MGMQETMTVMLTTGHGAEPEPVEIPMRVGTVKLGEMLGEGAGGVVFTGFDEALNRRVAVKLLHRRRGDANDPAMLELAKGVRSAAKIRHPHIITIHTVETVSDIPVIVMEYVDGASMRDLMIRSGPMDLPLAMYVMQSIISAVTALHEENVIHRDLKPANVLFDRDGEARVCDFGLACEFNPAEYKGDATNIGGSPLYMAPEIFEGQVSPQGDVYALGIMLFEALSGGPPFSAQSIGEIRKCHVARDVPLWRLEQHGVSEDICEVVRRALHKQLYLRFKTAAHMLRAIDQAETPAINEEAQRSRISGLVTAAGGTDARGPTATEQKALPAKTMFDLVARRAQQKRKQKPE